MPDITVLDLYALGASFDARHEFQKLFPHGATYREVLLAMASRPNGLEWWKWLKRRLEILDRPIENYKAFFRPVDDARSAAFDAAAKAYSTNLEAAQKKYDATIKRIEETHNADLLAALREMADQFFPAEAEGGKAP